MYLFVSPIPIYTPISTLIYTLQLCCAIIHPYSTFVCTGNWFAGMPGRPGIPANRLIIHIYCNIFKFYIFGTQVQRGQVCE